MGVATACILLPSAFSIPFELAAYLHSQVDIMHEERFSVTYNSSVVLTWNIAASVKETDKD